MTERDSTIAFLKAYADLCRRHKCCFIPMSDNSMRVLNNAQDVNHAHAYLDAQVNGSLITLPLEVVLGGDE